MALLGIDFGTANIRVVAAPSSGEPRNGAVTTTPAIVSFHGNQVNAGEPVLMMAGTVPDLVVRGIKRLVGHDATSAIMRQIGASAGWSARGAAGEVELVGADSASGAMSVTLGLSELLRYAVATVAGSGQHDAVVAVPAWFSQPQRAAFVRAAARAEIRVLRYVNDTVAAALWAAHAHGLRGRMMTIDVGAGGVSGSVVRMSDAVVALESTAGNGQSGGDDVDAAIATAALESAPRRDWELALQASEALKRELASAEVGIKELKLGERREQMRLERWELELLLGGLHKNIVDLGAKLVADAPRGVRIDGALARGGMAALASVAAKIATAAAVPRKRVPADEAVALGAVRLGMALFGQRGMAHELHDREDTLSTDRAMAAEAPRKAQAVAAVTTQKPVLRRRLHITQRRVDPRAPREPLRERRPSDPPADTASPVAPQSGQPTSDPPPEAGVQSPAPPRSGPVEAVRTSSPGRTPPPLRSSPIPDAGDSDPPAERTPPPRMAHPPPPHEPPPPNQPPANQPPANQPPANQLDTNQPSSPERWAKYPTRDGMPKYPARDRRTDPLGTAGIDAAATARAQTSEPRRMHATGPNERPAPAISSSDKPAAEPLFVTPAPSVPPHGSERTSLLPQNLPTEGTLIRPANATEILAMPMSRPLTAEDLDPIALPVLLRRILSRSGMYGTLVVTARDFEARVDFESGSAALNKFEHFDLFKAFDLPRAEWRLTTAREEQPNREIYALPRLALDAVRKLLLTEGADACVTALGDKVRLAPRIRPERKSVPKRLGLSAGSIRFIEHYFDGLKSAQDLSRNSPIGRGPCFQLFIMLELFDALAWGEPEVVPEKTRADELDELADKLERDNHFDVIGVHWSAPDNEIAARYEQRLQEFNKHSDDAKQNSAACKRIRTRIEGAWEVLSDLERRIEYRDQTYRGIDFDAATALAPGRRGAVTSKRPVAEPGKQDPAREAQKARSMRPSRKRDDDA